MLKPSRSGTLGQRQNTRNYCSLRGSQRLGRLEDCERTRLFHFMPELPQKLLSQQWGNKQTNIWLDVFLKLVAVFDQVLNSTML